MTSMTVTALQTPIFHVGENLVEFLFRHIPSSLVEEGMIVAVTSKIVSLAEHRLVSKNSIDKKTLTQKESEYFLGEIGFGVSLSIKQSLLLPGAGIDESNSESGDYILHPAHPAQSALNLRRALQEHWKIKNLGVILTDSRSAPLRLGTTGAALACAGFLPVIDKVGEKDLFGRALNITKVNMADSLASAAVVLMGEAAESRPVTVLRNTPAVFAETFDMSTWQLSPDQDMYLPLYKHMLKK